jgi:hypothetical protein
MILEIGKRSTMLRKKRGRPAKDPTRKVFPVRLAADLKRELKHYAVDQDKDLNDILVGWIEAAWKSVKERKGQSRHEVGS